MQAEMLREKKIISPWLFPAEDGGQCKPNHLLEKWNTYKKQHGLSSTIHEMRHTFISLHKSEMPLDLLKMITGHTPSTDTLGIYGHELEGDLDRAAAISDRVFGDILGNVLKPKVPTGSKKKK